MPSNDNLATSNNFHSNTEGGSVATLVMHNPDAAGQSSGISSANDSSSSDRNSSHPAASASQTAEKSVQVSSNNGTLSVASSNLGVVRPDIRISNPA
jgi:hypothetical protein